MSNCISIDVNDDCLYIRYKHGKVAKTESVQNLNILVDKDTNGDILGVEIINLSQTILELCKQKI
jgi:uncharacterized protein YuzE